MLEGFRPTVLRVFGGLCTFIDRIALGLGLSPDCKNVRFAPGMVATRDGYVPILADGDGGISGVTQHVSQDGDMTTLVISNGVLKAESPAGTLTVLDDQLPVGTRLRASSMFGERYLAMSDGRLGTMPLYRYNGTKASLVGAGAPGGAPTIAENAILGATGGVGLLVGRHSCVVVFVNDAGDVSGWSPVAYHDYTDATKQTDITVPLGPPDTVQRIIAITPKDDARSFLYTEKMVVSENTSTSVTLDITENDLLNSQLSVTRWLTSFVPRNPAGVECVQERSVVWGHRAALQPGVVFEVTTSPTSLINVGFRNLAFDGGFQSGNAVPNGWTAGAGAAGMGLGRGGASLGGDTDTPFFGKCLRMTGGDYTFPDPDEPYGSQISQTITNRPIYIRADTDYVVVAMLRPSKSGWSILKPIKLIVTAPVVGTVLNCSFVPSSAAGKWSSELSPVFRIASDLTSFTATLSQYQAGFVTTDNRGGYFDKGDWVDIRLAIYEVNDQQYLHTLSVSESGQPGTFVGEVSQVSVGPDDGEGIRSVFRLRDNVFVAKERALHAITSNTYGDPTTWSTTNLDQFAGTPSPHGVAVGNGFALIASRVGLYLFDGASLRLVSDEIESVWRSAAWQYGHYVTVVLDPARKVVRVALPTIYDSGQGGCSLMLALDHKEGWDSPVPSGSGTKWSVDEFTTVVPVEYGDQQRAHGIRAGCLLMDAAGSYIPVFAAFRANIKNEMASATDFSAATWTFDPSSPTITPAQPDGRSGDNATKWVSAVAVSASIPAPALSTGRGLCVSVRCSGNRPTVSFSRAPSGATRTDIYAGDAWTRLVYHFNDIDTSTASPGTIVLTWATAPGTVYLADLCVSQAEHPADLGFVSGGGAVTESSLLVSPTSGSYYDFSGAIHFLYETAPFGEEVGRSTFDRCVIRAVGNGYLGATYKGTGTRSWAMTSVQLAADADEDVEYGADLKAPAASLILTNTSENGWVTIKRVAVAARGELIGWLRGRN